MNVGDWYGVPAKFSANIDFLVLGDFYNFTEPLAILLGDPDPRSSAYFLCVYQAVSPPDTRPTYSPQQALGSYALPYRTLRVLEYPGGLHSAYQRESAREA